MAFEFLKSTGKNRRSQGRGPKQPPLPLIGVARSLPLIGLTLAGTGWELMQLPPCDFSGIYFLLTVRLSPFFL